MQLATLVPLKNRHFWKNKNKLRFKKKKSAEYVELATIRNFQAIK